MVQIAWDDAQRLAKRRIEREQGRNDAADDLSELSEGEKEIKGDGNSTTSITTTNNNNVSDQSLSLKAEHSIPRINSDMQIWSDQDNKSRHLYIILIRFLLYNQLTPYIYNKIMNCH